MPIILELRRQHQRDHQKIEARLGYAVTPCLKTNEQKIKSHMIQVLRSYSKKMESVYQI